LNRYFLYEQQATKYFISYRRYPDQLISALARVGGIIVFLKFISLVLKEYHRRSFESLYSPVKQVVTAMDDSSALQLSKKTVQGSL